MVSRWKLDEIIGTTTTPDAWGNNTGTLGDGVTASTYPTLKEESECVTGKCMYFDGVNDKITYNSNFYLEQTVSFWFNAEDLSKAERVIGKNISGRINWAFYRNSFWTVGNLGFIIYYKNMTDINPPYILSEINFKTNEWYFVSFVYKADGEYKVYVDGKLKVGQKPADFISWSYANSSFGMTDSSYKGFLDDVRIYNAALSTSQIKQEYVAGLNSLLANNNISKEEYDQRINALALNND